MAAGNEAIASRVLGPSYQRADARGLFIEVLNQGTWQTLIYGQMKAGAVLGNHYHKRTEVFFFLVKGSAHIDFLHAKTGTREQLDLSASQGVFLPTFQSHAIKFLEPSEFVMLKSIAHRPEDPDTYDLLVAE